MNERHFQHDGCGGRCGAACGAEADPLEHLTVRQAAALLSVSRPTVEKYVKAGELPSAMIGRCRRISRADLGAFMARRTEHGWRPYRRAEQPFGWLNPDAEPRREDIPF